MANPDHLKILKKGAEAWNWWRKEYPSIIPDLKRAYGEANFFITYLAKPDLTEANLSGADLTEADLSGAILIRANLTDANLWKADLRKANLSGADLTEADLSVADLTEADLSVATLYRADLTEANLSGADLTRADLSGAKLVGADLTEANLEAYLVGADLTEANLFEAYLGEADLTRADLTRADLSGAKLVGADLTRADLSGAKLVGADLSNAYLVGADLTEANLSKANLTEANLTEANLTEANLSKAILVEVLLKGATLTDCRVYGISVWGLKDIGEATQSNLIITSKGEAEITVDDLEIAQFIYLIRENKRIQNVIDNVTSKIVLILGRFQTERKQVLDALREELKQRDFVPIIFDFDKPKERDFTETVKTLAGMSLFVIADITSPKSAPLELQATIPNYMVPFVPIIQEGEKPFTMLKDLIGKYNWVLDLLEYDTLPNLIAGLEAAVIKPALEKHRELRDQKERDIEKRHIRDYRNK